MIKVRSITIPVGVRVGVSVDNGFDPVGSRRKYLCEMDVIDLLLEFAATQETDVRCDVQTLAKNIASMQ
jgi:hypothetical protein